MFDDLIAEMDAVIEETFSIQGVLNDKYTVNVVIDKDVYRSNNYGESIRNSYEITFFDVESSLITSESTIDIYNTRNLDGRYTLTVPVEGDSSKTVWAANVA